MALNITRILHAGYLFEHASTRVVFDPIFENPFSRNCHAFPAIRFDHEQIRQQRFDAVFISHFHDDHCSLDSLDLIKRDTPIYLYCLFDEVFEVIRALGFTHVQALCIDTPVLVGGLAITPRRALDANVDSMFQVSVDELNVLNVVDACIDPATLKQLARYAPWDMVLWPFQTMRETEVISPLRAAPATGDIPDDWLPQLQRLQPRYVVPSACQFLLEPWSWYNRGFFPISYVGFQRQIEAGLPGAQVVRLNPGVTITLTKNSLEQVSALPWIQPVGEQNVDYQYEPTITPPPMSEIARQLSPLTEVQMQVVMDYCRSGLPAKYGSLERPDDTYFQQARHWRLSVYSAEGAVTHFDYLLSEQNTMTPLQDESIPLAWCTEIVASKLYAALTSGETLTTLYLRINDQWFEPAIEAEIEVADLVDDPLIRCLFDDSIGAYQRDQLQRLNKRL